MLLIIKAQQYCCSFHSGKAILRQVTSAPLRDWHGCHPKKVALVKYENYGTLSIYSMWKNLSQMFFDLSTNILRLRLSMLIQIIMAFLWLFWHGAAVMRLGYHFLGPKFNSPPRPGCMSKLIAGKKSKNKKIKCNRPLWLV